MNMSYIMLVRTYMDPAYHINMRRREPYPPFSQLRNFAITSLWEKKQSNYELEPMLYILVQYLIQCKVTKWIVILHEYDLDFMTAKSNKTLHLVEFTLDLPHNDNHPYQQWSFGWTFVHHLFKIPLVRGYSHLFMHLEFCPHLTHDNCSWTFSLVMVYINKELTPPYVEWSMPKRSFVPMIFVLPYFLIK